MKTVRLGKTGLRVSELCLGCMSYGAKSWRDWVLEEADAKPFFRRAVELGFTFFDTADVYSLGVSEEITGRALKELLPREETVIATKVFSPMSDKPNDKGLSRKHILAAVDASLKRLGTDYIDLYQIHRFDPSTPIEETCEALNDVVRAGKARYVGASSMWTWQFAKMLEVQKANGWARFVSMQPQLNLMYREEEREMLPFCRSEGIGVIPWSPLARGWLAGRRKDEGGTTTRSTTDAFADTLYGQDSDYAVIEAVSKVAEARGLPNMQVAMAWVRQQKPVTAPIVGATKLSHLDDAVAALALELTPEEITAIEAPYRPKPVKDHA